MAKLSKASATLFEIRRSPSAASEIVRRLIPKARLTRVLNAIANSVQIAHQASPEKWGLTLSPDFIRLNVGFVEMLALRDRWFRVMANNDLIPTKLRADRHLDFGHGEYRNALGCGACDMDFPQVARVYAALLPAHESAIRIAARGQFNQSGKRSHSPALVTFLSQELAVPLPQPAYFKPGNGNAFRFPEEVTDDREFEEGSAIQILVNRYERDAVARDLCIEHYGTMCVVCGVSLADRYGPEVNGLVHVHHLTPLASIGKRSSIDPIRDLRPVCPNCHVVIHTTTPPRTVEQVREMLRKQALLDLNR